MFTKPLFFFCLFTSCLMYAQQTPLSLHSYFSDHLFAKAIPENYRGGSFFPAILVEKHVFTSSYDSTFFKNKVSKKIYLQHLVEVNGENYQLSLSPIFTFSIGKDHTDSIQNNLFQNTRGFYIEANLMKKVSLVSTFSETQARYSSYESNYYAEHGELYPIDSINFQAQNAVIPGASRTKSFKENAVDYSFSTGLIVYQPFKKLTLLAGNSPQFIGDGYRSMLLSDNAFAAPFFKVCYHLHPKWEINYMRLRALNLVRKSASSSVEAYYEPKAFSVNYYTYHIYPKIALSLFEGILWNMGDSLQTNRVNPLFYSPIPFLAELTQNKNEISSIIGMNLSVSSLKNVRLYGQFALGSYKNAFAYQLGLRVYTPFGWKNSMLQFEYNQASENMYMASSARLNYSHGNLPMAHPAGTTFNELLVRFNTEYKKCYLAFKTNVYQLNNYSSISLLPIQKTKSLVTTTFLIQTIEMGYRFNIKMNASIFLAWLYRSDSNTQLIPTNQLTIGIKTAITNHYNDF